VQRLHVVGFTTDHEGLILSARRNAKSGGYVVIADSDFEEALGEMRRAHGETDDDGARSPRPESTLSVREMQQRLRAGQSIEEVADAAGAAEEWIARFAIPIEAEQSLVVQRTLELVASKQRIGPSSQPLGTSAWWNLQDRGVKVHEDEWSQGWSAYLQRDQVWVVQFAYTFRKKRQVAEWEVDLRAGTVHSRNRLGTDLGYVEPGRRRRPGPPKPIPGGLVSRPTPSPVVEPDEDAALSKPRRATPKRRPQATVKRSTAKKAPVKKKSPAKKTAAKKTAAKKTAAKKTAAKKTAAKKTAPRRAAKKTAAKRPAAKKARPAATNGVSPVIGRPAPPRVVARTAQDRPRPTPTIAGAARAREPVASVPVAARRRPTDTDGRPLRRREPLRARS